MTPLISFKYKVNYSNINKYLFSKPIFIEDFDFFIIYISCRTQINQFVIITFYLNKFIFILFSKFLKILTVNVYNSHLKNILVTKFNLAI